MAEASKTCVDCGYEYQSKWKTAKRCAVCRVLTNASYTGIRSVECYVCDAEFLPRKRGNEWCGECEAAHRPPSGSTQGHCVMCDKDTLVLHEDIQVCLPCTTNPERRKQLVRALIRKQSKRKETNAPTE